jgi:hypothetical protein
MCQPFREEKQDASTGFIGRPAIIVVGGSAIIRYGVPPSFLTGRLDAASCIAPT